MTWKSLVMKQVSSSLLFLLKLLCICAACATAWVTRVLARQHLPQCKDLGLEPSVYYDFCHFAALHFGPLLFKKWFDLFFLLFTDFGPYFFKPHSHLLLKLVSLGEFACEPRVLLDSFHAYSSFRVGIKKHLDQVWIKIEIPLNWGEGLQMLENMCQNFS